MTLIDPFARMKAKQQSIQKRQQQRFKQKVRSNAESTRNQTRAAGSKKVPISKKGKSLDKKTY